MAQQGNVAATLFFEIQKKPSLFDKIKYAYDENEVDFSVLLGSAQILLLKNVRETLAGRVFVFELFPLMLSELASGSSPLKPPLIERLLGCDEVHGVLRDAAPVLLGPAYDRLLSQEQHLLEWGGMPGLLPLEPGRRRQWLKSYEMTYLERDLGELAKLLRTKQLDAQLFYYRTRSGLEVDFLLQTARGVLALEVKSRERVTGEDTRPMQRIAAALGEKWLGGLVVYRGNKIEDLRDGY